MYATVLNDKTYQVGAAFPSICQLSMFSMFSWSTSKCSVLLQIIGICDSIDVALACDDEQIRAHRLNLSAWSSLLRHPLLRILLIMHSFKISFSTVPSTYSHGAVVNSSGITLLMLLLPMKMITFGLTEFLKRELSATRITLRAFA